MTAGSSTVHEGPALTISRPPRFWPSPFGWSFAAAVTVALVCAAVLLVSSLVRPAEPDVVTLKGIMASKGDFFEDEQVQRLLLAHHMRVEVTRRGSREVALEVINQQTEYDFAFPSGRPAANLIKEDRMRKGLHHDTTSQFTSPMVLATYREYAETLRANDAAVQHSSGLYYELKTPRFIELGETGRTWTSIGIGDQRNENNQSFTNGNRVLAHTSGVCRSNSGAAYLSLVAFVKNGGRAPAPDRIEELGKQLQPLVTATGMPESELFASYVTPEGRSLGPIIVVYEHQYLAYQLGHRRRAGKPDSNRVLLYPQEESQTDPEYISLKKGNADRLADVLKKDPALRTRMMELGYRVLVDETDPSGTRQLFQYLTDHGVARPDQRRDLTKVELPDLEPLEKLIRTAGRCAQ